MKCLSKSFWMITGIAALLFIVPATSFAEDVLKIGLNPTPAWKMQNEQGELEGPEVELMKLIGERLGLRVEFEVAPFKRCLKYMETGEVDLMSGLLKRPEREAYITFVEPPYKKRSNKIFYVLKGSSVRINSYEDLAPLRIGKKSGVHYFPKFDNDAALFKDAVTENELNVKKLLRHRIDTYIVTESTGDYLLYQMGELDSIEKADYRYSKENPVYIGFSKKSALIERQDEIIAVIQDVVENGDVDRIIAKYFTDRQLPIPDYK